jgi:hypothetical protein
VRITGRGVAVHVGQKALHDKRLVLAVDLDPAVHLEHRAGRKGTVDGVEDRMNLSPLELVLIVTSAR